MFTILYVSDMYTMIFISSMALLVGIVGSVVIWGMDARRSEEIEHPPESDRRALGTTHARTAPVAQLAKGRHAERRPDITL